SEPPRYCRSTKREFTICPSQCFRDCGMRHLDAANFAPDRELSWGVAERKRSRTEEPQTGPVPPLCNGKQSEEQGKVGGAQKGIGLENREGAATPLRTAYMDGAKGSGCGSSLRSG